MSTSHLFVFRIHRPVLSSFALSDHVYSSTFTNRGRQTTFNGPFSGTTQVSRYQKGKTNLDFTEARDSEWQWLQLGHMQVCTSLQTDNHASNPPLSFLQGRCSSCHPTNSVNAIKGCLLTEEIDDFFKFPETFRQKFPNS